jgi:transcriptional regulator GlxA family with amidase domain
MLAERAAAGGGRVSLHKSLSYINSLYTDRISVPELAEMENLSVSRYNAVFRSVTGMSPTKYIMGLRINHASTLLSSTDMDIGQIGEMVGYADKHFFSRVFKSYTGLSPREYRIKSSEQQK